MSPEQSSPDPLLSFLHDIQDTTRSSEAVANNWASLLDSNVPIDHASSSAQWIPDSTFADRRDVRSGVFDFTASSSVTSSGRVGLDARLLHGKERHESTIVLNLLHPVLESSLKQYLDCIHPLNPTLNKDTILARFAGDVHLYDRSFTYLLLSICCLGKLVPNPERPAKQQEGEAERADDLYTVGCHKSWNARKVVGFYFLMHAASRSLIFWILIALDASYSPVGVKNLHTST